MNSTFWDKQETTRITLYDLYSEIFWMFADRGK